MYASRLVRKSIFLRVSKDNMALIKLKPSSPGRRAVVRVVNSDLHKGKPHAPLLEKKNRTAGRNHNGHITVRHMGGGHK